MSTSRANPTSSGGRVVVDEPNERIHSGRAFFATHSVSVGTGTAVTVLLQAPASSAGDVDLIVAIAASNAVTWTLSEAPNASGGTALTAYNLNRNSANTSPLASLTHTATYVSSGTILENHVIGTNGAGLNDSGGARSTRVEWVLKYDTLYLIRAVALNAGTTIDVGLFYYPEKTD